MRFGLYLGRVNPSLWPDLAATAEEVGFESVWIPEHLILPSKMSGSPMAGESHPPIDPATPTFDALSVLAFLAARTTHLKLGTWVYVLGLRHPFVAARAVQTVDVLSAGRLLLGVGAGWLQEEWDAVGLEFASRGRRLDEALDVCRRLWSEQAVAYDGEFFRFEQVMFEPKPVQRPHPPIFIGGESRPALRRAAKSDGWMGMNHDLASAGPLIAQLQELRSESGSPSDRFEITVGANVKDQADVAAWTALGVDRLIVSPWTSTRDALVSIRQFADRFALASTGDLPPARSQVTPS